MLQVEWSDRYKQPSHLYTASIKAGTKQNIKAKTSNFYNSTIPWKLTCCFMTVAKFAFNMLCKFTCWLITSTLCCCRCVHNHSVAWDDGSIRNGQPALWVKNKDIELVTSYPLLHRMDTHTQSYAHTHTHTQ